MFVWLLVALLAAAAGHIALSKTRSPQEIARIVLLYVLVGYCGVPMVLVGVASLLWPGHVATHLGFPAGNPFQDFLTVAYLGMALLALLAVRYRGTFLIGPAVCWTVFFTGATVIHLRDFHHRGVLTHESALAIFVTHGLVAVLLASALVLSGLLKQTR